VLLGEVLALGVLVRLGDDDSDGVAVGVDVTLWDDVD